MKAKRSYFDMLATMRHQEEHAAAKAKFMKTQQSETPITDAIEAGYDAIGVSVKAMSEQCKQFEKSDRTLGRIGMIIRSEVPDAIDETQEGAQWIVAQLLESRREIRKLEQKYAKKLEESNEWNRMYHEAMRMRGNVFMGRLVESVKIKLDENEYKKELAAWVDENPEAAVKIALDQATQALGVFVTAGVDPEEMLTFWMDAVFKSQRKAAESADEKPDGQAENS